MLPFCHHSTGPMTKSFLLCKAQSLNHKTDGWGWEEMWRGDGGLKKNLRLKSDNSS